jgi:thiol-disulfide isomerase/thioredoxin
MRVIRRKGSRLTVPAALAASLALAAALAGCTSSDGAASGSGFVAGDGTITVIDAGERSEPVDLSGTTLEGTPLDVASLRGGPVVVNVWGSWCSPCRKEAPDLEAAHQRLKAKDVSFLGINTREEDAAQALAFQRTFEVTYPSLADEGGTLLLSLRGAVAPNAIPTTLVLDDQGRIAARITGATTEATLVDVVESVIG